MTDEKKDEVIIPEPKEVQTETETQEKNQETEESQEKEESEVELTAEEAKALKEENEKLKSDNENYKKAVKAEKQKNKPKELPEMKKDEFVSKKEFYQESQNKAKAKAREEFPELSSDQHWNEIITEYYHPKTREGKTTEENTFLNLKNAVTLWKAYHKDVDTSAKKETAKASQTNASPSKGDTSQPKKNENTDSEDYYLQKLGIADEE